MSQDLMLQSIEQGVEHNASVSWCYIQFAYDFSEYPFGPFDTSYTARSKIFQVKLLYCFICPIDVLGSLKFASWKQHDMDNQGEH